MAKNVWFYECIIKKQGSNCCSHCSRSVSSIISFGLYLVCLCVCLSVPPIGLINIGLLLLHIPFSLIISPEVLFYNSLFLVLVDIPMGHISYLLFQLKLCSPFYKPLFLVLVNMSKTYLSLSWGAHSTMALALIHMLEATFYTFYLSWSCAHPFTSPIPGISGYTHRAHLT